MKKLLVGVGVLFVGLMVLTSPCHAAAPRDDAAVATPAESGLLAGYVRDVLTGQAVPGAFVHLRGRPGGVRTDGNGHYQLAAPPGTWELVVSASEYLEMSRVGLRVLPGRRREADFEMVLANPTSEQSDALFHTVVVPPDQNGAGEPAASGVSAASVPSSIRVLMPDGQVVEMDLDEYLKGVVPSEMPAYAPLEALKAQAVAARSYAVTSWNHPAEGANVCTTQHCQVWRDVHYTRTDEAVEATSGMVAEYDGQVIRAYYFGHCDGHTRNSEDVWWQALPYCRSVECVCGFDWLWGHGVGMCQRGAMEMGEQGATFDQILKHYYTGISIFGWEPTPTPTPTATPTPSPVVTMTYALAEGWNMLSFPMLLDNASAETVFAPVAGKYDLMMQYDAFESYARWKVFNATLPGQSNLEQIDTRYGIWLRVTDACTLTVSGQRIVTDTEIPLNTGLNLVGYPSTETRPITETLSSIEGKYVRVYTYDASAYPSPWLLFDFTAPAPANTLTTMVPGAAYWIEATQPCVWSVEP